MVARIIIGITGGVAVLVGGSIAAGGALGIALAGERVESASVSLDTPSTALVSKTAELDIDGDIPAMIVDDRLEVRIRATPRDEHPLFLGIARTADIERLLRGTTWDEVIDVDGDTARLERRGAGVGAPVSPTASGIWVAQATGSRPLVVDWSILDAESGGYSAVLMRADGSPGVRADAAVGARIPSWVGAIGWAAVVIGAIGALAGLVALVAAIRRPAGTPPAAPAAPAPVGPAPAAPPIA